MPCPPLLLSEIWGLMDFMAPGCLTSSRNFKEKLATPMLKGHKANATNAQKAKVRCSGGAAVAGAVAGAVAPLPWAVSELARGRAAGGLR